MQFFLLNRNNIFVFALHLHILRSLILKDFVVIEQALFSLGDCVSLLSIKPIPSSSFKPNQIIALQAGALALYDPF